MLGKPRRIEQAMPEPLDAIVGFLNQIGIEVREGVVPESTFLPGLRIVRGTLEFEGARLRWPGDLLHEAGHIAVTPASIRATLNDGVELPQSILYASEIEAIAWAFAAVHHLQLDPAVLFHPDGYHGHSAGLIHSFTLGVYPGAFGLAQAGMTSLGPDAQRDGKSVYPAMSRWLRA